MVRLAILLSVGIGIGCLREGPRDRAAVVEDTSAGGRVRIRNVRPNAKPDTVIARLVPDNSFRGYRGDVFGQIRDMALDVQGGRLFVLDGLSQTVVVLDTAGNYQRTLGGKGGGPGRFVGANGLVWQWSRTLWVADPAKGTFTVFDAAGALVRAFQSPIASSPAWQGVALDTSHILQVGLVNVGAEPWTAILASDVHAGVTDTILNAPYAPLSFEATIAGHGGETTRLSVPIPFAATCRWAIDRKHVWTSCDAEYRLYKTSTLGDTIAMIEREYRNIPVPADERRRALERIRAISSRGVALDESRVPSERPAFDNITVSENGEVWLALALPSSLERTVFDILEEDGTFMGQAWSPIRLLTGPGDPILVTGTHVYAVGSNGEGPVVHRLRIVKDIETPPH